MTRVNLPSRVACATTATLLSVAALAGCTPPDPSSRSADAQILGSCPPNQKIATFIQVDASGSSRSEQADRTYLHVIEQLARRTAICGGRLTVTAFSESSGSTETIVDQDIQLSGHTENARLRRVTEAVERAMEEVERRYAEAMNQAQGSGTDVVGMYRLASEHQAQFPEHRLELTILTDGATNQGVNISAAQSAEEAHTLAESVTVPHLPGASITVAGLGRVAGNPLPSETVAAIRAFYDRLCERTEADACLNVTDWR